MSEQSKITNDTNWMDIIIKYLFLFENLKQINKNI